MTIPAVHKPSGFPACVHLIISFNDHAVMYQTVAEWVKHLEESGWLQWTSSAERAAALETDLVWSCQWYPDSPVGFFVLAASTFDALMCGVNSAREATQ